MNLVHVDITAFDVMDYFEMFSDLGHTFTTMRTNVPPTKVNSFDVEFDITGLTKCFITLKK